MTKLALTIEEAAEALGVGRSHIYRLLKDAKAPLPSVRIGRCRRILVKDLEAYAERLRNGE